MHAVNYYVVNYYAVNYYVVNYYVVNYYASNFISAEGTNVSISVDCDGVSQYINAVFLHVSDNYL